MDDISQTIMAKSDQLNAADLIGDGITVKINSVTVKPRQDQPVSVFLEGDYQPFKPCKGMRRVMAIIWGTLSSAWVGHSMTIYCSEDVLWAGKKAGGIRISAMSGITETREVVVKESRHKIVTYVIVPIINYLLSTFESDIEIANDYDDMEDLAVKAKSFVGDDLKRARGIYARKIKSLGSKELAQALAAIKASIDMRELNEALNLGENLNKDDYEKFQLEYEAKENELMGCEK